MTTAHDIARAEWLDSQDNGATPTSQALDASDRAIDKAHDNNRFHPNAEQLALAHVHATQAIAYEQQATNHTAEDTLHQLTRIADALEAIAFQTTDTPRSRRFRR